MSEIRKRIKDPAPTGWEVLAAAIREVREQIRESFGPQQEVRLAVPGGEAFVRELDDALAKTRENWAAGSPLVVNADPADMAQVRRVPFETREEQLKREIRDRVLDLCGFADGGEVTADGSANNDLAHERADAVMDMLEKVRRHGFPQAVAPPAEGAPLYALLNALRPLVYRVVNATAADDAELTENVDVIMAFVNLAREHQDPKRLLPRGDRLGDWLPPGTPVVVHLGGTEYPAVVEPDRDNVTVRMDKINVVTEYPRNLISKEGEPWTPPKPTDS